MNCYQFIWDVCGYGKRVKKIMSVKALYAAKLAACQRVYIRMSKTADKNG